VALDLIEPLAATLSGYFHFFGVRGALLLQLGRNDEAREAFNRSIALARTPAEAAHIRRHLDGLERAGSTAVAPKIILDPPVGSGGLPPS
jgi:RNA polymerase sigma-70 factor (ECF subfamily)